MASQMHAWIWPWCPQTIEQHSHLLFTLSLPVLLLLLRCSLVLLFALTAYGDTIFFPFEPYGSVLKALNLGAGYIPLSGGAFRYVTGATGYQRKVVWYCVWDTSTKRFIIGWTDSWVWWTEALLSLLILNVWVQPTSLCSRLSKLPSVPVPLCAKH